MKTLQPGPKTTGWTANLGLFLSATASRYPIPDYRVAASALRESGGESSRTSTREREGGPTYRRDRDGADTAWTKAERTESELGSRREYQEEEKDERRIRAGTGSGSAERSLGGSLDSQKLAIAVDGVPIQKGASLDATIKDASSAYGVASFVGTMLEMGFRKILNTADSKSGIDKSVFIEISSNLMVKVTADTFRPLLESQFNAAPRSFGPVVGVVAGAVMEAILKSEQAKPYTDAGKILVQNAWREADAGRPFREFAAHQINGAVHDGKAYLEAAKKRMGLD